LDLETAGACRAGQAQPDLPFARLQSALRLRPRRALSSAGALQQYQPSSSGQEGQDKSPLLIARPALLTTNGPVLLTTAVRFCSHRDTKKKMGSKCESTPSPENTGRSEPFRKFMRNRWRKCPRSPRRRAFQRARGIKLDAITPQAAHNQIPINSCLSGWLSIWGFCMKTNLESPWEGWLQRARKHPARLKYRRALRAHSLALVR